MQKKGNKKSNYEEIFIIAIKFNILAHRPIKMQKLDDVDRKILDILIDNTRTPFTEIAKRLLISAGTVHVSAKKMEDLAIIKGSSLTLDYKKLGYNFIAYVGILIDRSRRTYEIIEELKKKPHVTVAHITTGKYNTLWRK